MAQFILIGMCIGIEMSTISPLITSKYQHGQYCTLKKEYLLPIPSFPKIIVLHNFRYNVNAGMDNTPRTRLLID